MCASHITTVTGAAVAAIHKVPEWQASGFNWVLHLTENLKPLTDICSILQSVLALHGWENGSFATAPNLLPLLTEVAQAQTQCQNDADNFERAGRCIKVGKSAKGGRILHRRWLSCSASTFLQGPCCHVHSRWVRHLSVTVVTVVHPTQQSTPHPTQQPTQHPTQTYTHLA